MHAHHRKLAQKINWYNQPVFWETERMLELMITFHKREAEKNEGAKVWLKEFDKDMWGAAKKYWQELLDGQNEAFTD